MAGGKKSGPSGSQTCVVTCPMGALKLVAELPSQTDISGYDVNLAPPPKAPSAGAAPGAPSTITLPSTATPAKKE